jgi:8-oxo-dGTP pyrophosphatase MutT (NUDIX family)
MQTKIGVSGILTRHGKILLGKRLANDASLPGKWCTPGGGVEFGETLDDALIREFKEETGLDIEICPCYTSVQERIRDGHHTVMVFRHVRDKSLDMPKALDGFEEVRWLGKDDFISMNDEITEMTRHAIAEYIEA